MRRDLDDTDSHTRMSPAKSAALTPFQRIRILPRALSSSIKQSDAVTPWGTVPRMLWASAIAGFDRRLPRSA